MHQSFVGPVGLVIHALLLHRLGVFCFIGLVHDANTEEFPFIEQDMVPPAGWSDASRTLFLLGESGSSIKCIRLKPQFKPTKSFTKWNSFENRADGTRHGMLV